MTGSIWIPGPALAVEDAARYGAANDDQAINLCAAKGFLPTT